jgi:hypothetical protein
VTEGERGSAHRTMATPPRKHREDLLCARLVALRFFAGLTQAEAAEALGMARRTADRHWAYARAWLYERLRLGEVPVPADPEEIPPGWRSPVPDGALGGDDPT